MRHGTAAKVLRHKRHDLDKSIQQQLELMETGKVMTGENRGSGWVDTTAESIERSKARLVELGALLTESGPATVSKPKH